MFRDAYFKWESFNHKFGLMKPGTRLADVDRLVDEAMHKELEVVLRPYKDGTKALTGQVQDQAAAFVATGKRLPEAMGQHGSLHLLHTDLQACLRGLHYAGECPSGRRCHWVFARPGLGSRVCSSLLVVGRWLL